MKPVSLWKNDKFVRLFSAFSISIIGDYFDMIAISVLLAYTWHLDPVIIAFVPLMYAVPGVLFGSYAGVITDRLQKRKLMIASDLISALLTFGLMFASSIYVLFPLIFIRSTVALVTVPAQQSLTRSTVHEDHLLQATSFIGIVNQLGKVAGPLIGAAILSVASPLICLFINGVSSIISASLLLSLKSLPEPKHEESTEEDNGVFAGWKIVFNRKILLASFIFGALGMFAIQLVDTQFSILTREMAPNLPALLGWLMAASGLGAVVGMLLLNKKTHLRYGWSFGGGLLLIALSFIGFGLWRDHTFLFLPIGLGLLTGLGNGFFIVSFQYLLQTETPQHSIGKVFGVQNAVLSGIVITAPPIGGFFVKSFGVHSVFFFSGVIVCVIALIGIVFQKQIWNASSEANDMPTVLENNH